MHATPEAYRAELAHRRDQIGTSILGRRTWRRTSRWTSSHEGPVTGLGTGAGNSAGGGSEY